MGKSGRILRDLGQDRVIATAAVVVLVTGASAVLVLRHRLVWVVRRHHGWAHLVAVTAPMAAVAVWDLERRGFDPAAWEGLHYLYLGVPALLVAVAQHRGPPTARWPEQGMATDEPDRQPGRRIGSEGTGRPPADSSSAGRWSGGGQRLRA